MPHVFLRPLSALAALAILATLAACGSQSAGADDRQATREQAAQSPPLTEQQRLHTASGFAGPESVHYDPKHDVYYVGNFNGDIAGDANGFVSRVSVDGQMLEREFMAGTTAHPLHAARGMQLQGDTLWVADAHGVHQFATSTGEQLQFVDFSALSPGFLNDIAIGRDGSVLVTDTSGERPRVYRIKNGEIDIVADAQLVSPPNGITWAPSLGAYVLASWGDGRQLQRMEAGTYAISVLGVLPSGGNCDGIEDVAGTLLIACQQAQAVWAWRDGHARVLINTPGNGADIGIDTKRNRIAVPYVALDRVDVWALPD